MPPPFETPTVTIGDYPNPLQWAAFTLNGDPEGCWNASGAIK